MFRTRKIEILERRIKSLEYEDRDKDQRIDVLWKRVYAMEKCLNMEYIDPSSQEPFYVVNVKETKTA